MRILIFGLSIRIIIAFINSYFGPTLGGEGDALGFHDLATSIATDKFTGAFDSTQNSVGWGYASFLAMLYGFADPSLFLGCLLSCIAWLISGILLDKTLSALSVDSLSRKTALIIYAFLPSGLLFTSVTLREVYQLLFINLAIFSIIKIVLNKNFLYWIVLVLACIGMSYLHMGLSAYALILIGAAFFLISLRSSKEFPLMKFLIFTPIIFIGIYFGLSVYMDSVSYDFSEGIAVVVAEYRSGHNQTRAMYAEAPELNSFLDLLLYIPLAIFQYFLEPFPWRIATLFDLALFFENLFRLMLIIVIIKNIFILTGQIKIIGLFLFTLFLILEIIWALGTVNWGSAARHHIPGLGLLVISTFYILAFKKRAASLPS